MTISVFTDDELSGIGIGPEHGVAMTRINELIADFNTLSAAYNAMVTDESVMALCTALDLKVDESEVSKALNGSATKKFYFTGALVYITSADTASGNATINIGTTTGGAELAAARTIPLTAVGEYAYISPALAYKVIDANATVYVNVESADGGTALVANIIVMGKQF
jgi:hypothetical protein